MWEWRERGSEMGVKERRGEGAEGRRSGLGAQRFRTAIRFKRKCTLQRFRTATIIIIHAGNHCAHPQPFPIKPVAQGHGHARASLMDAFMSMGMLPAGFEA